MPTYEYQCEDCECRFDVFHGMNDSSGRKCPECGGNARRMIGSGSGIIFKGPGFYATDYAKKGKGEGGCSSGKCCCEDS